MADKTPALAERRQKIPIGGINSVVLHQEIPQFAGVFHQDTGSSLSGAEGSEILQEGIILEGFLKIRGVRIEEGCRGLDNRTELDRTVWGDMVGQPHRARANRLAVCVPIGVDDEEFGSTPLFDDEPAFALQSEHEP